MTVNWEVLLAAWTLFGWLPAVIPMVGHRHAQPAAWAVAMWLGPSFLAMLGLAGVAIRNWWRGDNGWLVRERGRER